jgi:hypothetical protein
MSGMVDFVGNPVIPATSEEIETIRYLAQETVKQDHCTDHPCEFYWAEECLKLIALIDEYRREFIATRLVIK